MGCGCVSIQIQVAVGVSFTSIENARRNLHAELAGTELVEDIADAGINQAFNMVRDAAADEWDSLLGRIDVEGGTDEQKQVFYTALYHTLIHPSILNDVNGDYPVMESDSIGNIYENAKAVTAADSAVFALGYIS